MKQDDKQIYARRKAKYFAQDEQYPKYVYRQTGRVVIVEFWFNPQYKWESQWSGLGRKNIEEYEY